MSSDRGAQTRAMYRHAGFTGGFRLGGRPALLVVDLSRGFTDPAFALGADAEDVLERTAALLDAARRRGVLVVFTTIAYDQATSSATAWVRKAPSLAGLSVGSGWVEVHPRLSPRPDEAVLVKTGASAFFGTPLCAVLASGRIDTVLVLGATTSGCVRASVVDAVQHGYDTFVVTDCCADRAEGPHKANLFDMTAKYADGITAEEVRSYLEGLPERGAPSETGPP
ncbi:MAG: isochorismatase family protein [Actinomycetota bacterium]|nr:isochorismatase family protein [Actinomycetota bacterium]